MRQPGGRYLADRVALVTGGGRGLGRAIALALAGAGADVAVAARTREQLEETAAQVEALGVRALAVVCDVTDPGQVQDLVARVEADLGPLTILVNNAGTAASARLTETSDELWERMLRVNATGTFYAMRAALPGMLERGWGRIVNIASTAARQGSAYVAAYAASKHAVLGLTRAAAVEVAARGVTVNAVCPGWLPTELTEESIRHITQRTGRGGDEVRRILEGFSPQRRLIDLDEVAQLVCFLCSDAARGINGQGIVLDGGGVQR